MIFISLFFVSSKKTNIIILFIYLFFKKLKSNDQGECLKLTFDELCHIRNVLTKAELDYLLFDNQLFNDVAKGKVCFSCRKTKFNLFNFNWGHKCQICQQKICKKCLRNVKIYLTSFEVEDNFFYFY